MWCSNQLVDQLAKDAAETARLEESQRCWLAGREAQLKELVIFLGMLTHAANSFVLPDGKKIRDSTAVRSLRRSKHKCSPAQSKVKKASGGFVGKPGRGSCVHSWRMPSNKNAPKVFASVSFSRASSVKRAQAGFAARQEATFQDWWRESRSQSLRPRVDSAPSAKERLDALKARVAARGMAASDPNKS